MIITLAGNNAFKIQTGGLTIVTEGPDSGASRAKPDILLRTAHGKADLPEAGFSVDGPGEYEIQGVEIQGIPPFTYVMKAEDLRLALISEANVKILDKLNRIDIVFIAHAEGAASFIRQIEPRMVIAPQGIAQAIAKELGAEAETMDKVTVKKKDIPSSGLKCICLAA